MFTFDDIQQGAEYIASHADKVRIKTDKINSFLSVLKNVPTPIHWTDKADGMPAGLTLEQQLMFAFVFIMTNFCYWPDPKWRKKKNGQCLKGADSLLACYNEAYAKGVDLLNPEAINRLTPADYKKLVKGDTACELCLIPERYKFLRQAVRILQKKYNGSVLVFLQQNDFDAEKICNALATEFPGLNDEHEFKGRHIVLMKRAVLAVSDLNHIYEKNTGNCFKNMDKMCASAGYKLPQVLHHAGILEYAPDLEKRVREKTQLPSSCTDELEIRGCAMAAVEKIKTAYNKLNPDNPKTTDNIDKVLWILSQTNWADGDPHHNTLTWFY